MTEKFKNKIKNIVNELGYYEAKKIIGVSFTELAELIDERIPYDFAHEILIENINNKNIPTEYKEFKIHTSFDGVLYWSTKIKTGHFLSNIIEHIHLVATPFWDGNEYTPVELDWYALYNDDTNKKIVDFGSDGSFFRRIEDRTSFKNLDDLFQWYKEFYLPTIYNITMNDFLPNIQQVADDELDERFGPTNLEEQIRRILKEEVNKKFLKPNEKTEKLILDRLNNIFSDMNIYHVESYKTRHDFEFCKNGKEIMNLVLFFEETNDRRPTSERTFIESTLFIPKELVNDMLTFMPIRKNYLHYVIEEWFEDNFLSKISNMMGRNDISVDELSFRDSVDVCVPPITEKPEDVTQEEMIKVIMNNTLWRKKDLVALEEREPGSIERMYLQKLRNIEMDRLRSNR